ncbi:MAG: acyloxyacyl hydrolase [Crocinitomicaceae bacterium]|nr:acyloxyacyl hydrolase [Crocinitomicaceae bacterium]
MKLLSFLLFLLVWGSSFGQRFQQFKPTSVAIRSKGGFLIAHRANMAHLPKNNTYAFEVELVQQDVSDNKWADIYKKPLRGISFQYQEFGNKDVLGQGYSVFAHTSFPLFQGPKFGFLDLRMGTGIGWVTKMYDTELNPKNSAIGSHLNGYVNFTLQWQKYFRYWNFGTGIEFGHYSNCAMKVPNLGLNVPSLMFNIGYNFEERQVYEKDLGEVEDENSIEQQQYRYRMSDQFRIFIIGSAKQNEARFNPPKSRPVIAIQGLYSLNVGRRWKVDFALDGIFNGGNQYHLDSSAYSVGETIQFGVFVGASIHFYKAEFHTGIGAYFRSPVHPFGFVYNRLGFRYHFTDKFSGILGIKSHLAIADYLEIGIGYKLWSKEKRQ